MKITVKRVDFVKGTVKAVERGIPDTPPSTPLMDMLRKSGK